MVLMEKLLFLWATDFRMIQILTLTSNITNLRLLTTINILTMDSRFTSQWSKLQISKTRYQQWKMGQDIKKRLKQRSKRDQLLRFIKVAEDLWILWMIGNKITLLTMLQLVEINKQLLLTYRIATIEGK
jgi:hypothetical protein